MNAPSSPAPPAKGEGSVECRFATFGMAGFTLLEMLVALVILAIGMATAVIALRPDESRLLGTEADRLALLLEQAREESAIGGMPLAWIAREDGYEFQRRELTETGPSWNVIRVDDLFHPRDLPVGLHIRSVEMDGHPVDFGQRVALGADGVQKLTVEMSGGEARSRVASAGEGFEAVREPGRGTL